MMRKLTHIIRRPSKQGLWVPMAFVTQTDDNNYHLGYETSIVSDTEIQVGIKTGVLQTLDKALVIYDKERSPWLDENYVIHFALINDPMGDKDQIILEIH